jgi:cytochrome c oxidase assembly protein subunit 15
MSLAQFKTIYWWEWGHSPAGAARVGAAFLLPFLWFLWRGDVGRGLRARLWTIFALGGALGAVGWWMVSSGLSERVSVSQYRLAFHLTLACAILAMVLWTAQRLVPRERVEVPAGIRAGVLMIVLVQIYLGALVAGCARASSTIPGH